MIWNEQSEIKSFNHNAVKVFFKIKYNGLMDVFMLEFWFMKISSRATDCNLIHVMSTFHSFFIFKRGKNFYTSYCK